MTSGTVKFYNEAKGFGFLIEDGSNNEVFVHMSGLIDGIKEGDKVTFEITQGKKGPNAENVKLA
jgi:CspA family cold shock protein